LFEDHRRVEALFDRCPDGEGGSEVVAVDREVGPVPGAQLLDVIEEVIGGVAGEDIRQSRFDADPDQRQPSGGPPLLVERELLVAQLDAGKLVRPLRGAASRATSPCPGSPPLPGRPR
jgi:hypothetical protein